MKAFWIKYIKESPLPLFAGFLMLFSLLRVLFLIFNLGSFKVSTLGLSTLIFGVRLDAILSFYLVVVLYFILPLLTKTARYLFLVLFIAIPTVIAGIDAAYFKFSKERLGLDFGTLLKGDNNISLWTYINEYWWLILFLLILITSTTMLFAKLATNKLIQRKILVNLFILGLLFLLIRGGLRSRPLRSADTPYFVMDNFVPLALNPTLLLFESLLTPTNDQHLAKLPIEAPPIQQFNSDSFKAMNVVVLVLESFGKEYTGLNQNYAVNYTPFLNDLMEKSLVCTDAYANGLKSMDAVPAIFCGLPRIQGHAIINTPNSLHKRFSLMECLKPYGYKSHFFHGADNNSMGFRSYLKAQGLNRYYGIDEYPNADEDTDGHWGIYDVPYLQYVVEKLNTQTEPFVAGVFTLSSHHPYAVPPSMKNRFPKGNLKIHQSIGYTDFALDSFFKTVATMPWFANTIFVITADHSSENALHTYRTPSGKYEIPIIFYSPSHIKPKRIEKTVSQIDILPTILDLINYPKTVALMGNSVLNNASDGKVCHFDNGQFHITSNGWNYGENNGVPLFLYHKKLDVNCLNNLLNQMPDTAKSLSERLSKFGSNYKAIME